MDEPDINLTPLIDVVFVILIMFIVVAPLLEVDRIHLATGPSVDTIALNDRSPVTIHVHADDTITLNNHPVTPEKLAHYLTRAHALYPTKNPQLYHDEKAHFGTYQMVKNAAQEAGFTELDLVLKPQ